MNVIIVVIIIASTAMSNFSLFDIICLVSYKKGI